MHRELWRIRLEGDGVCVYVCAFCFSNELPYIHTCDHHTLTLLLLINTQS